MSGYFSLNLKTCLLRGSKPPQGTYPSAFRQKPSALKALRPPIPGLRVERADSLFKPEIAQVSPEKIMAEQAREARIQQIVSSLPKPEVYLPGQKAKIVAPKKRSLIGPIAAGGLAALAATLIPSLAAASQGGALGGALVALTSSPLGIAALVGGGALLATFYVKYLFGFDKGMELRNANPGNPSLRRQLAMFSLIPLPILAGSGLLYLGACLLPWGTAPTFFALAGAGLVYGIYKTAQSIRQTIRANQQTITPGYKSNPKGILSTNILSHGVQGAEAAYIFYRGATLFELLAGVGSLVATCQVAGLLTLASGAASLGIPLFILTSIYLSFTSKKWNELQHKYGPRYDLSSGRGIRTVILAAAGCAAAGALIWGGAPVLLNIVLAVAFFYTEVHALIHNWSCQTGSREIIQTPPEEYSDTEVWNAARRPQSPWITAMKPSLDTKECMIPLLATLYLRKGTNWDFINIVSTKGVHADAWETHECMRFLREKQEAILEIIERAWTRIGLAPDLTDRYEELAAMYEEMANLWQRESAGDFSNLTVSELAGRTNVFRIASGSFCSAVSSPAEGTIHVPDNFERYLGEAIAYEGHKFRQTANEIRNRSSRSQAEIDEHLETLTRQYSVIFHAFAVHGQFRNTIADIRSSKIRKIDIFNQLSMTYKTGGSILRKNRHTGEYYWEFIPCKRIRALDTATNTLHWTNRADAELAAVETYSDVRHLDNTGLTDPAGPVHSREAYTYGAPRNGDHNTVVYENGRRETHTLNNGIVTVTDNGVPRDPNSDEVVWVPGMPITPQLEAALPAKWKDKGGKLHEDVVGPSLSHFFSSRYQTMLDGEHVGIIVSDFLAPMEKDIQDPYVFAIWKVPEQMSVPNALPLRESTADQLVRISPFYANFMFRVTEEDTGLTLYIPYDWKKNPRMMSGNFWKDTAHVELMSRDEFRRRFGRDCRDNHGDKHPNVIVAYDARGNKLGKPEEALPYSNFLRDPHAYSSVEFDRGLGRIGDMVFVGYTFQRPDGTRYLRWLPREKDWPEIETDENHQSFEVKGQKIVLRSCRWIGKRFYYDQSRLGLDPGNHENPNFEVTGIEGPQAFLGPNARSPFVIDRCRRNADGSLQRHDYAPFDGRIKNLDNVVDQRVIGSDLELTRITPDDKQVVELGTEESLNHPSTWISGTSINSHPTDRRKVRVTIDFTNPFDGSPAGTQDLDLDKNSFPDLDSIYQGGNSNP
jgi:hypothetical protein